MKLSFCKLQVHVDVLGPIWQKLDKSKGVEYPKKLSFLSENVLLTQIFVSLSDQVSNPIILLKLKSSCRCFKCTLEDIGEKINVFGF